jgi:hypothetical protein
MKALRVGFAALAAVCFAAAAPRPAHAVIGGALDPNTNLATGGVASLAGGGGVFSAVLISPYFALTAAHVVSGSAPSAWTVNLNSGGDLTSQLAVDAIFVAPGYTGVFGADGVWHSDLAVLRLAQPAPAGVQTYAIAGMQAGDTLTLVGYGASGPIGGPYASQSATVKHAGTNRNDLAGLGGGLAPFSSDVYAFDVDPGDATVGPGDSGSAAFVFVNGQRRLAGINTFALTSGASYVGGGGMVLSAYQPWIDEVTAVPVPAAWLTLSVGLALLALAGRRRTPAA